MDWFEMALLVTCAISRSIDYHRYLQRVLSFREAQPMYEFAVGYCACTQWQPHECRSLEAGIAPSSTAPFEYGFGLGDFAQRIRS